MCTWTGNAAEPLELLDAVRSHAGDREIVGNAGGDLADLLEGDRVECRDRAIGVDVLAEDDRLRGPVAGHRASVLEAQHETPCGVGARSPDLLPVAGHRASVLEAQHET